MADKPENSIRFSADVDSTPERVVEVAKMFKAVLASAADDEPTGTVTMTVANREMVATLNPRDPAALVAVSRISDYLSSPARAAQSEEGRSVLTKVRDFCRTLPLDSRFEYKNAPALTLDEEYWEEVSKALGDDFASPGIEEETFIYGRVSSVSETGKVKLNLEDGSKHTFKASEELTNTSARLFKRDVYAQVTFTHQSGIKKAGELMSITGTKKDGGVIDAFEGLQRSLHKSGTSVTTDWLKD